MPLRGSLKGAIICVIILGVVVIGIPLLWGNLQGAGEGFIRWVIGSLAILFFGMWDEHAAKKDKE